MTLTQIADGVFVHESECLQSNTVIVQGREGVLIIDPGLTSAELETIARDVGVLGPVVAAFATHAHWDHVLWHPNLGDAPRYATATSATAMRELLTQPDWVEQIAEGLPEEIADDVPMSLLGLVDALPPGTEVIPWDGPTVRILEHNGHEQGHAALLIEHAGVLVAGDMLSDVLVPMLGLHGSAVDPLGDYLAGLEKLSSVVAELVVPGHGSVGRDLRDRIAADRAYVEAMRDRREVDDPRIGPDAKPGWEWVVYVHEGQRAGLGA
jgi:glyoxylase-like metal-dependent hydrolase (beta-lactamase superfamily II)